MTGLFIFLLKAMGYGVGLSSGFWMFGMISRYIEYYAIPFIDGRFDEVAGPKTSDEGKTFRAQFEDEWFHKPFAEQIEMFKRAKRTFEAFKNA